ncbi:unnamed protein product [Notodromas monacha]|uniref:Lamin-B receptor n=1 Tax=Notodromas monacha TaxID=399045 RepID=A0A7R9BR28_9CRUS|nr:unnamed protein product [Notodromas monacha]CAG0918769.1 unnamed protein product [Notodromas monacha]
MAACIRPVSTYFPASPDSNSRKFWRVSRMIMGEYKRREDAIYTNSNGESVGVQVISFRPAVNMYNIMFENGKTELVKPNQLERAKSGGRGRQAKSNSPRRASRSRSRSRGRTSKTRRSAPIVPNEPDKESSKAKGKSGDAASSADESVNVASEVPVRSRRRSTRIAAQETTQIPTKVSIKQSINSVQLSKSTASWLAIIGATVCTVAIPASLLAINMMCDKKNCHLRTLSVPRRLATFYDPAAWMVYFSFAMANALLLVLPVGRKIEGPVTNRIRQKYRCNGWLSFLLSASSPIMLDLYVVPIEFLRAKFFALMTAAWIFGTLLSAMVYMKNRLRPGRNLNVSGQTGNMLVDWHAGRETIPRIGSLFDLKLYAVRLSINGTAALTVGLWWIAAKKHDWDVPPQMTVCGALMLLCFLDFFLRENDYLTTYDYLKTGAGYAFFSSATASPFLCCLPMRFLHDQYENKLLIPMRYPDLVGLVALFLVGYLLYLIANRIKNGFRRDPNSKRFADLETIATASGKSLIVSFPWGWVRRPNYVGNVIMMICIAMTTGFGHVLPYVLPLTTIVFLVLRTFEDEARLAEKYGNSWTRYCQRVPHRFIPKVF